METQNGNQGGPGFSGEKISLDFQDAEVGQLIRLLADTRKPEPYNLVLDPSVKGKRPKTAGKKMFSKHA